MIPKPVSQLPPIIISPLYRTQPQPLLDGFAEFFPFRFIGNDDGSLLSGENVTVIAGRDVKIGAATETDSHYQLEEKKKSGLLGSGGIGFTVGKQSTRHEIDEKGTTQSQSVSTIGSSQGSVNVTAGNRLHVGGADLVAGKDMNLTGDSVSIDPGFDQRTRTEKTETKQSGLTLALSGTAGSALNTAVSTAQQARKSGDGRVSALQNTRAALNGVQAAQAVQMDGLQNGGKGGSNTVGVSASYGSQSSKSETRTESSQSQGSTLTAGRNLTVTATGKNGTAQSGDISITGSQLKAGGDMSLEASRDILLQSAQNTRSTDSKNSSKGGSVGVGIGVGSGGYGISVSASVNAAKGSEKGNGLTHSETTLDAGSQLSLTSGRDTTLTGAQASGESVKVDAGRNLTLTSEQDSDRYDSKQQSASAGGSFTFGSMTGSANVNVSRDKMHSNWQSVAEQTGIFAGKGGFDVTVGEHTQLNGAVIGSTASADENRLDTGTLGFGDIENHAEYEVEHQSAGISTGGGIGGDFAGNMANGMLAGLNGSGSASSVTKSAVSEGTIVIRDTSKQTQDVADLSRDVANANPGLDVIFDKEKEQNRLKAAQLTGEIGSQAGDIARTQGQIIATRAANEKMSGATQADRDRALAELKAKDPTKQYSESDVNNQVYSNFYDKAFANSGFGTGGKVQQAISAAAAAVQGLSGGNVAQAVSGAASPYLAEQIHKLTEGNPEANLMAHAVVGAVVAQASGNSALTGAAGAATASVATSVIAKTLYGTDDYSKLNETQKQTISALSTLASGLAGGLTGDSAASAVAGAQAGKNTSENNDMFSLPSGLNSYGGAASTLGMSMAEAGATTEEINAALSKNAKGDLPEGANITKVIVDGYKDGVLIAGAGYLGPAASIGKVVAGATIAEIANGTYQWVDINSEKNQSLPENQQKTWDYWGSASAAVTGALAPGRNVWQNVGIAAGGAAFTDGADTGAIGIAAGGAGLGWGFGEYAPGVVSSTTGKEAPGFIFDAIGSLGTEFLGGYTKDLLNTPAPQKSSESEKGNEGRK